MCSICVFHDRSWETWTPRSLYVCTWWTGQPLIVIGARDNRGQGTRLVLPNFSKLISRARWCISFLCNLLYFHLVINDFTLSFKLWNLVECCTNFPILLVAFSWHLVCWGITRKCFLSPHFSLLVYLSFFVLCLNWLKAWKRLTLQYLDNLCHNL